MLDSCLKMFTSLTSRVLKNDALAVAATTLTWQAQVGSKLPISVDHVDAALAMPLSARKGRTAWEVMILMELIWCA